MTPEYAYFTLIFTVCFEHATAKAYIIYDDLFYYYIFLFFIFRFLTNVNEERSRVQDIYYIGFPVPITTNMAI